MVVEIDADVLRKAGLLLPDMAQGRMSDLGLLLLGPKALSRLVSPTRANPLDDLALRDALLSGAKQEYFQRSFDLTTARTDEEVHLEGDFLQAWTDGTLAGVGVRLNTRQSGLLYLDRRNELRLVFHRFFLTNTAQGGKTLDILVGGEASADATSQLISAQFENKVSATLDSTTANLGDGATYTGAQFSVEAYGRIVISLQCNRAGTLYVDQTNDGTNYDIVSTFAYTAADTAGYSVEVLCPNARVRFANSAGAATTTLRLYARARRA